MSGLLAGKRIVVTGVLTDDSLAYAVADLAQREDAEVVLTGAGRGLSLTRRVARHLPSPPDVLELDVTVPDHVEAVASDLSSRWGAVDGVLHSIGFAPPSCLGGGFLDAGWDDVKVALEVSAYSLKVLAAGFRPLLQAAGGGSVVGLDFDATVAWPGYDWMGVAKAALESTARYLARDLGPDRIRVNLVAAGSDQDHGGQVDSGLLPLRGCLGRPGAPGLERDGSGAGGPSMRGAPLGLVPCDDRRGGPRRRRLPRHGGLKNGRRSCGPGRRPGGPGGTSHGGQPRHRARYRPVVRRCRGPGGRSPTGRNQSIDSCPCAATSPPVRRSRPPSPTSRTELGPVEVLVSNAGLNADQLLLSMKEDAWTRVIDANLTGAYRVARRATSKMIRARRGRIIFISSVVALTGSPGQTNYSASKAGLIGLARSLAREIAGRGVTVNVVTPGFVATDMTAALPESRQAEIVKQVPLGRMATPRGGRRGGDVAGIGRRRLRHRGRHPGRRRVGNGTLMAADNPSLPRPTDVLPHRPPFLFVDEVTEIVAGRSARGRWRLTGEETFFSGHFPGRPTLPGVLMVEALAQLGGIALLSDERYRGKLPLFGGIDKARFRRQVGTRRHPGTLRRARPARHHGGERARHGPCGRPGGLPGFHALRDRQPLRADSRSLPTLIFSAKFDCGGRDDSSEEAERCGGLTASGRSGWRCGRRRRSCWSWPR